MKILVVLPCCNEENNIAPLIIWISECLKDFQYHIIVVDDGSSDNTFSILKMLKSRYSLRIVRHRKNLGFSRAIQSGLKVALEENRDAYAIITMDADMTHDPSLIPSMINTLGEDTDLVIASRYIKNGRQTGVRITKRLLSRSLNLILNILFNLKIKDCTSGFRCWKTDLLRSIIPSNYATFLISNRFQATFELLIKAIHLNARVTENPVHVHYEKKIGRSKMSLSTTIIDYLFLSVLILANKV